MTNDYLNETLARYAQLTEGHLARLMDNLSEDSAYPHFKTLCDAMRYSLLAGGKRMRPALVYAFCSLFGGKIEDAVSYACALEMVHTFSLIHDDMPCMDNDDLRRGKPTNHVVFGESCALLAGDSLLSYAFEVLPSETLSDRQNLRAVAALSHLCGPCGMCGGQQIDLENEGKDIDLSLLQTLHAKKTGALIKCACVLGCIAAGVEEDTPEYKCAVDYAASLGIAFQIADDILDVIGESCALLAGDSLLSYAFEVLPSETLSDRQNLRAVAALSHLCGPCGMCGGQQIDLENEGKDIDLSLLQTLHAKKTGALIKCACVLGCIAAGVEEDTPEYKCAVDYAASLGIAFQIADDILDVIGDEKKLGKKCGSDKKDHKNTYVTLLGLEQSKVLARELALSARTAVGAYDGSRFLCELADYTITRES